MTTATDRPQATTIAEDPWAEVGLGFDAAGGPAHVELRLDRREYTQRLMVDQLAAGGFYEPEVSHFLANVLQPGDAFIDVGSHVGYFAMLAAAAVGPTGRVVAVEPEPRNAARVREHAALNGFAHVEVCEAALGAAAGEGRLSVNRDNDGGHALWPVGEHPFNASSREAPAWHPVAVRTLDGFLDELRGHPVRLVKIDAEGAEKDVLRSGMLLLHALEVPFVICEINEFALGRMGTGSAHLRAFMQACGYACYRMTEAEPYLEPFPPEVPADPAWVFNVLFTTRPVA